MDMKKLWRKVAALPPDAQRELLDFLDFLSLRYATSRVQQRTRHTNLADEPFIGMWRDREDMQDSNSWVRSAREREWGAHHE